MALTPSRSATAATWTSFTGTLTNGEVTLESDTGVVKVGDGITLYAKLPVADNQVTSAARIAIMSDETGTGAQVYATAPTITLPSINNEILGYTTVITAAGTTVLTVNSNQKNFFTGSTTQTLTLPVASTLTLGQSFYVRNNSSGIVTVNSSGGNLILAMPSNTRAMFTCILTSATDTTSWSASYAGFATITGTGAAVLGTSPTIATPTITGVLTSGGTDTSSGAAVTSPAVTSGVAFTPSTTQNTQVTFQLAGTTGTYTITYGPSTGAENGLVSAVPTLLNVGTVVDLMVPKGWKVVLTLVTVTLTSTKVTTF